VRRCYGVTDVTLFAAPHVPPFDLTSILFDGDVGRAVVNVRESIAAEMRRRTSVSRYSALHVVAGVDGFGLMESLELDSDVSIPSGTTAQASESLRSLSPEDEIDWWECLKAIYDHNMELPARYLRTAVPLDRRVIHELADKLDPRNPKQSHYLLRNGPGRPRTHPPVNLTDPIEILLQMGLKGIADHLRRSDKPDQRAVDWLADRLDRSAGDGSHFVVKQPRGKPPRQSRLQALFGGAQHGTRMLGLNVELKRRAFGKLEAALHHFTKENTDWRYPVSRSRALRAHQLFLQTKSLAKKNNRV
jgi:hypothetical protein